MALDLNAIHRALATQLRANIARDTDTNPFPIGAPSYPCITVYPDPSGYLTYLSTFAGNGYADLRVRLKLEVDSDEESTFIKITDYLAAGTGFPSSIWDAIRIDKTLGGLVDDCYPSEAEWDAENDPTVAWIPVQIIVKKAGAQP